MQFRAVVIPSGNATAVELPDVVMQSLGPEARPPVTISINGHSWRSRVAVMNGQRLVGISAANRAAAGIEAGQTIDLDVSLDTAPRDVEEPDDLRAALDASHRRPGRFRQVAIRPEGQACPRHRGCEDVGRARPADRQTGGNAWRLRVTASARTAARYRLSSALHRSAGRGCTGPNAASPPSRAVTRSFPRRAAGAPSGPSRGRPCGR